MEQNRSSLKISSMIVLAFAVLSMINLLFELFFGELNRELNNATIAEGAPDNIVLITRIVLVVLSLLMLLPQIYIGIKGLKMAKKPDSSCGHIVWGVILLVFTAVGLLTPIFALVQGNGSAFGNIAEICSIAVDVFILFEYVKYARAVRKGV